jgi:hypothetical protein
MRSASYSVISTRPISRARLREELGRVVDRVAAPGRARARGDDRDPVPGAARFAQEAIEHGARLDGASLREVDVVHHDEERRSCGWFVGVRDDASRRRRGCRGGRRPRGRLGRRDAVERDDLLRLAALQDDEVLASEAGDRAALVVDHHRVDRDQLDVAPEDRRRLRVLGRRRERRPGGERCRREPELSRRPASHRVKSLRG